MCEGISVNKYIGYMVILLIWSIYTGPKVDHISDIYCIWIALYRENNLLWRFLKPKRFEVSAFGSFPCLSLFVRATFENKTKCAAPPSSSLSLSEESAVHIVCDSRPFAVNRSLELSICGWKCKEKWSRSRALKSDEWSSWNAWNQRRIILLWLSQDCSALWILRHCKVMAGVQRR